MKIEQICPGCMREVENRSSVEMCPHCGYDLKNTETASHQLKPLTILAGKYIVGKVIGEGGFGISYMGLDLNLELVVAIKEFYPNGFVTRESNVTTQVSTYAGRNEADVNKWKEGFLNEARSLAKFSKLNGIVEVRDFFNENGTAYIIMEYVDGITLKQYLKENGGRIPENQVFAMMEPVIRSLAKVHETGMIHRDISPDNIMISQRGEMKLLDFGAARKYSDNAEKSLSIMLKPGYAPEEQYRSHGKQGPWSDVYALTATIYKCITGITPIESMERLREDTLKMPRELGFPIGEAKNAAIKIGMAVYADERIQSMGALYTALYMNVDAAANVPVQNIPVQNIPVQNAPGHTVSIQTVPVQNMYVQNAPFQNAPVNNSSAGAYKKSKSKKGAVAAVAALSIVLILVLAAFCIAMIKKNSDDGGADSKKASRTEESQDKPKETKETEAPQGSNDTDGIKQMISDGKYEDAINQIVKLALTQEEGAELLQKAVDGLYQKGVEESNSLAGEQNFDAAHSSLAEKKQLILNAQAKLGYMNNTHESDIDTQDSYVSAAYNEYWGAKADEYAAGGKEDEMIYALDKATTNLDEASKQKKKELCYASLVCAHLDTMQASGNSKKDMMNYISRNLASAGNNCRIIERWFNYYVEYSKQTGKEAIQASQVRNQGGGYVILDSNTRELTAYELSQLTYYEKYIALFEIYARYGRLFADSTLITHFSKFNWYAGNVSVADFNESALNGIERKNISALLVALGVTQ